MDKEQAIHNFWSSFGVQAYDENSVPDNVEYPYIAYTVSTGKLDSLTPLYGNIYYNSTSWKEISNKVNEIARRLAEGVTLKLDDGYLYLYQGTPFAQRLNEPNNSAIKRYYIQLSAEFLTSY